MGLYSGGLIIGRITLQCNSILGQGGVGGGGSVGNNTANHFILPKLEVRNRQNGKGSS